MSFLRFILAAALMLCGAQFAGAQTFPALTGRVVDDAHLLSAGQVAQLTQLSTDIEKASSRQFVVATIPDLQGHEIEDYGYQLGRAWKIGQGGANNGIILIVAPKEHKVRIEVGYGLEPIMTDALSSTIINDTIVPKFKAGDIPGGIIDGANAIAEQMKLPLEAGEARAAKLAGAPRHHQSGTSGIPFVIIFWVVVAAFVILSRLRRGTSGRRYRGGIAPVTLWGSGLGGGWGSSWSSGGGGSSWGGGDSGGGFSGGGGSFGGGGASGGW